MLLGRRGIIFRSSPFHVAYALRQVGRGKNFLHFAIVSRLSAVRCRLLDLFLKMWVFRFRVALRFDPLERGGRVYVTAHPPLVARIARLAHPDSGGVIKTFGGCTVNSMGERIINVMYCVKYGSGLGSRLAVC
jgi:hypothetical protein